eukprot:272588-Chlamydomonas_euryale.AAC.1
MHAWQLTVPLHDHAPHNAPPRRTGWLRLNRSKAAARSCMGSRMMPPNSRSSSERRHASGACPIALTASRNCCASRACAMRSRMSSSIVCARTHGAGGGTR